MKMFGWLAALSLHSAPILASELACNPNVLSQFETSNEILRFAQSERLRTDAFGYCNSEMAKRYLASKRADATGPETPPRLFSDVEIAAMSDTELLATAERASVGLSGWPAAMIPSAASKERALFSSIFTTGLYSAPNDIGSLKSGLQSLYGSDLCGQPDFKPATISEGRLGELAQMQSFESGDPLRSVVETGASSVFCAELVDPLRVPGCTGALTKMVGDMRPRGQVGQITQPELYDRVLSSGAYDRGLKIASLKMIERYERGVASGANLFGDLKQSFVDAGASAAEADAMSWDTLGLISTAGTNLVIRMEKLGGPAHRLPVMTALSVIAAITPALDHKYGSQGPLYSWPAGVRGSCDTSKNYHFWMAAYLARQARLNGADGPSSVAAAYSAAKAYANVGNLTNRAPGAILAYKPFAPAAQIMRADLAQALTGATFGAGLSQQKEPLSTDRVFGTLIRDAKAQPPLKPEETGNLVTNYWAWSDRFQPNGAYRQIVTENRFLPTFTSAAAPQHVAACPE